MRVSIILGLLFAALAASAGYITDITVDVPSGQIYVVVNNGTKAILYELDNVDVEVNAAHYLPKDGEEVEYNSLAIVGRGNARKLVSVYGQTFAAFKVPIGNKVTLPILRSTELPAYGMTGSPFYDTHDNFALLSITRNITLVSLNSFTVLDTFAAWVGSRIFGRNFIYNYKNNHLYKIYTRVPYSGNYGISVVEYQYQAGVGFAEVDTTYDCLCQPPYNATDSPFYKVVLASSQCDIDYTPNPPHIWCVADEQAKLLDFNANNMTNVRTVQLGVAFSYVAWDFRNKRAFAFDNTGETPGFSVHEINLTTGAISRTYASTENIVLDLGTTEVDPAEPHLYIGVINDDETQPHKIVFINTDSFNSHTVVTLSSPDL
jgi:hypothetical protein